MRLTVRKLVALVFVGVLVSTALLACACKKKTASEELGASDLKSKMQKAQDAAYAKKGPR